MDPHVSFGTNVTLHPHLSGTATVLGWTTRDWVSPSLKPVSCVGEDVNPYNMTD